MKLFKKVPNYNITYIAGPIRCGKSNLVCKIAQQYIKAGWSVYSNHSIYGCYKFDLSDLAKYRMPENSVVIIDESGLEMNSRDFKKMSKELLTYYKKCGHYKNKVYILSQTFSDTDKQVRELAEVVLFIRVIIPHVLSMPVRVNGNIQIGDDGQPCMKYKMGKIGRPNYMPRWFKYYNSFEDDENREIFVSEKYQYNEILTIRKKVRQKIKSIAERFRKLVAERVAKFIDKFKICKHCCNRNNCIGYKVYKCDGCKDFRFFKKMSKSEMGERWLT